jgi:hypothetical protein
MSKLFFLVILSFMTLNCSFKNKSRFIDIQNLSGKIFDMYFINDSLGYSISSKMIKENQYNIYINYTQNGGVSWQNIYIDKLDNIVALDNEEFQSLKIGDNLCFQYWDYDYFNIVMFDVKKNIFKKKKIKEAVLKMWENEGCLAVSKHGFFDVDKNEYVSSRIDYYNKDLELIRTKLFNSPIFESIKLEQEYFVLKDSITNAKYFGTFSENKFKKINIPFDVNSIYQLDSVNILILGVSENEDIVYLKKYNEKTRLLSDVGQYSTYNNFSKIISNEKLIVFFIEELISQKKKLIYSYDKGKTWQEIKVKDDSFVKPYCLVNNILYVYNEVQGLQILNLIDDKN